MCELCNRSPCSINCPNHEPKPVGLCSRCEEQLYAGDWAIKLDDGQFLCDDCLTIMTPYEIVEFLGYKIKQLE